VSKEYAADGLLMMEGPIAHACVSTFSAMFLRGGANREGAAVRLDDADRWIVANHWATQTENAFMNIIEALKGNYDAAASLWESYKERLKSFRSDVKNDVTSLEASARKTTEATQRMLKAYSDVITLMNSEQMAAAVENAERLAKAMDALAGLQAHRFTLVVDDEKIRRGTTRREGS
jgi:DNA repair exonuclease SbcCD ATPase subunit